MSIHGALKYVEDDDGQADRSSSQTNTYLWNVAIHVLYQFFSILYVGI